MEDGRRLLDAYLQLRGKVYPGPSGYAPPSYGFAYMKFREAEAGLLRWVRQNGPVAHNGHACWPTEDTFTLAEYAAVDTGPVSLDLLDFLISNEAHRVVHSPAFPEPGEDLRAMIKASQERPPKEAKVVEHLRRYGPLGCRIGGVLTVVFWAEDGGAKYLWCNRMCPT